MTKSIRSVNVLVRIDFIGDDVSNNSIKEAIDNMEYNFSYEDDYVRIVDIEIIDSFVKQN